MARGVPPLWQPDVRACINRFRAHAIPHVWIAGPELLELGMRVHLSERWRCSSGDLS